MEPNTPILTITLQIPVLAETNADEIMEAISARLNEALEEIRRQQENEAPLIEQDDEIDAMLQAEQEVFRASVVKEVQEAFTAETHPDLLASLGYKSRI